MVMAWKRFHYIPGGWSDLQGDELGWCITHATFASGSSSCCLRQERLWTLLSEDIPQQIPGGGTASWQKKKWQGAVIGTDTQWYMQCVIWFLDVPHAVLGFSFFFSDALLSSLRTAFRAIREQFALDTAMEVVAVLAKLQPPRLRIRISLGTGRETHHERMNKCTPYTFRKDRYLNICNIDMICTLNNLRQNWL